jgi:hypothetical protein
MIAERKAGPGPAVPPEPPPSADQPIDQDTPQESVAEEPPVVDATQNEEFELENDPQPGPVYDPNLMLLISGWLALEKAGKVKGKTQLPPTPTIEKGWNRVMEAARKDRALELVFADIPVLLGVIEREAAKQWVYDNFRVHWLFQQNPDKTAWKAVTLWDRDYGRDRPGKLAQPDVSAGANYEPIGSDQV